MYIISLLLQTGLSNSVKLWLDVDKNFKHFRNTMFLLLKDYFKKDGHKTTVLAKIVCDDKLAPFWDIAPYGNTSIVNPLLYLRWIQ